MTNPEQSAGPAHPARAAGYVLLGVAVIALAIGMISLFTGGSDDDPPAAQSTPPSATSDTASGDPTTTPSTEPSSPAGTSPTSPGTSAPTTPGSPGTTTTTPPPPVVNTPQQSVRVYNNSTTPGLATRVSDDVERAGWQVAEKGNYSSGNIPTTTVYFRPGTDEEAPARELARILNARVEPRFDGIENAKPGIILIVTNDYKGPTAKAAS